jgi:Fic family protein
MLMQQWQALSQLPLPASLKLSVATARLLQVHPFSDGNGRTARWYGLAFVMNNLNASNLEAKRLRRLWGLPSSLRHAASYAVCRDNDWSQWFDLWMGTD